MDAATTTLIVAVATVLTSGVSSAVVTYRLNRSKEQTFFMRRKAEELYLAADEFGRQWTSSMVPLLGVLDGRLDYNQMLDIRQANPIKKDHGGAEMMEMLTRIYFPEALPELSAIHAARSAYNTLESAHKAAYQDGAGMDPRWKPALMEAMRKADKAVDAFKVKVVRLARVHASAEARWFLSRSGPSGVEPRAASLRTARRTESGSRVGIDDSGNSP
ncbi:MAG: hypothetical protein JNL41_09970 [Phenylobacterium sp.]|uniref:hypothetical protein n=1 Tax=Phenylobacterium sp. TaxID=1871053 RepID=UPI001A54D2CB|nr:hypothetical protein [Phenylobacterium sp.]MBL8554592.1 hypothetical protein [Phenylobacterium sp.]